VHHFPTENNYAFLAKAFKEIYNAVAPGGTFVLNHASHEQHRDGYWWLKLMPKTCDSYCQKSPPMPLCIKYMREAGFTVDEAETYVPLEGTLMSSEAYLKNGLESTHALACSLACAHTLSNLHIHPRCSLAI
jgi:spermidine synthase